MKLTAKEQSVTVEVTTAHDYDEKYMVVLKEGFYSNSEEVGFFNTKKEVKSFIKNAKKKSTKKVVAKKIGAEIVPFNNHFLLYVDGKSIMFATKKDKLVEYAKDNGITL